MSGLLRRASPLIAAALILLGVVGLWKLLTWMG